MKIAFVSTILEYPWGGADTLWTKAAEAASARGDSLLLALSGLVAEHPRILALRAQGARVHVREDLPAVVSTSARLLRRLRRWGGFADSVVNALRRFRPDMVIFSCGGTYELVFLPAWMTWLRRTRTPFRIVANWQMEDPSLPASQIEQAQAVFATADAAFFVSNRNLQSTQRHLRQLLPRAKVLHNPLRWNESDVSVWPASPPWNFATVSRLHPGKGIGLFLEAAAKVLPHSSDWHANIYGVGPEENDLQCKIAALGLERNVEFRGYVPELRVIWKTNHLMVSPSIEDGVPMTIPEAAFCRRPILATSVGAAEEWVTDRVSGFLSPAPQLTPFASALKCAWDQREQWEAMGRVGAAAALAYYRADDYLKLIE